MSIKSESSQLSGFSGISTISCSSPKLPSTINNNKNLDKTLQKLTKCEKSIVELAKLKLIYECLENITTNNQLPSDLNNKLEQILLSHNVEKYLHLPTDTKHGNIKSSLLGIMDVKKPELTVDEKKVIRKILENNINIRTNSFIKKFEEAGGNYREALDNDKSGVHNDLTMVNDNIISHWRDKLEELCNEYQRDILKCDELLNEWQKYKFNDMEELNLKKADEKYLQAQIAEAQAKITKITCSIKMFKETPITIDAFKKLSHDLDDKINNIESEIKKKKALKKQYEELQNTEYDDVLKRYLDLCSTIKKEERLLEML